MRLSWLIACRRRLFRGEYEQMGAVIRAWRAHGGSLASRRGSVARDDAPAAIDRVLAFARERRHSAWWGAARASQTATPGISPLSPITADATRCVAERLIDGRRAGEARRFRRAGGARSWGRGDGKLKLWRQHGLYQLTAGGR